MYLESNKLSELPEEFFQNLRALQWLDLRNNDLVRLPTPGLKDHPCLQVILLQGNRIKSLPVELGKQKHGNRCRSYFFECHRINQSLFIFPATIPNLRGLQTAGNPVENVPYEAVVEGFQGVMKHLKKLSSQTETLRPVSESFVLKTSSMKGASDGFEGSAPEQPSGADSPESLSETAGPAPHRGKRGKSSTKKF